MKKVFKKKFRFDLKKVAEFDAKNGGQFVLLAPEPERYEWVKKNGESFLYDKLDNIYFSKESYNKMLDKLIGKPVYGGEDAKIGDLEKYAKSRIKRIIESLEGKSIVPTIEDKSEKFLESLSEYELRFAILSLDIVGSTKLITTLEQSKYNKIISTALFELSEIIPLYHGHVLKYTGDGLIAYFPEPTFIIKNDLTFDCALILRSFIYDVLNPILKIKNLPEIDIRIGLDSGNAFIETIGSPKTKQHKDIIGRVVSLAAKIQSKADKGGISLGKTVLENLHTSRRKNYIKQKLYSGWTYKDNHGKLYDVYKIKNLKKNYRGE